MIYAEDPDEVLISNYEVDAIVEKVVDEIGNTSFIHTMAILIFITICAMSMMYEIRLLLG